MKPITETNGLICSARGEPKPILANAISLLRNAGGWEGVVTFDAFAQQTMLTSAPPWEIGFHNQWQARPWEPHDDILAAEWLQRQGVLVGVDVTSKAVEVVAKDREVHPVLDYLDGLEWDGVPRIDSAMKTYFGAEASPYTEALGRILFLSSVARIMLPGCKADQSVILEGEQNTGKSTGIRILSEPWFSDEIADLGSKDSAMQVAGVWVIEIAELSAMTRSEVERVKAFMTRREDRFRPPYGRRVIKVPRQCIFVGTTNGNQYLQDETGNRRFLPVRTGRIDLDALARDRDQLWAEAVTLHASGAKWWIVNPRVERAAREEQMARMVTDPWEPNVADYVDGHVETKDRPGVSVSQILSALDIKVEHRKQGDANRVARILKMLGLTRFQVRYTVGGQSKREWRYRRSGPPLRTTKAPDLAPADDRGFG